MTVEEAEKIAGILGKILNGNAVGFFVMIAGTVIFAFIAMMLWRKVEKRMEDCDKQHQECEQRNREMTQTLSQVMLDMLEGRPWEAK